MPLPNFLPQLQEGGQIASAQRGLNALTKSKLDNIIYEAKAKYAEATEYANNASKMAYAQFVGPQAVAHMMNDPVTRGMFTPAQRNELAKVFTNQLGSGNAFANLPAPNIGNQGGGLLTNFLNRLFGGQQTNRQPMQQMPFPKQQQPTNAFTQSGNQDYGDRVTPEQQDQILRARQAGTAAAQIAPTIIPPATPGGVPQMPATQKAASLAIPGTLGGYNSQAGQEATEAGLKTGAVSEAQNLSEEWKLNYNEAKSESKGAVNTLNILNKLKAAFDEMGPLQRGRIGGKVPALSTAAIDFDTNKVALADAVARAQQQGHITEADRQTYAAMKLDRDMTKDAFKHQYDFTRGMSDRIMEKQGFDLASAKMGLTPQQADVVWNYYIRSRPFYDPKTHKYMEDNIGSWEDFLTPQKQKEAYSPRQQKITAKEKEKREEQKKADAERNAPAKWIEMDKPIGNGKYERVEIDSRDISKALKKKYIMVITSI